MEGALYVLRGSVGRGRGKGRTVGMPTANLIPDEAQVLPPQGVYATRAQVDGTRYIGVTNVGTRPSVDGDSDVTVETFLFDYSGDLYGKEITLLFYRYLRPVQKFASLEAVKAQVERDARAAREALEKSV